MTAQPPIGWRLPMVTWWSPANRMATAFNVDISICNYFNFSNFWGEMSFHWRNPSVQMAAVASGRWLWVLLVCADNFSCPAAAAGKVNEVRRWDKTPRDDCLQLGRKQHKKERSRGRYQSNKASKSHRPLDHLVAERTTRLAQVKEEEKALDFYLMAAADCCDSLAVFCDVSITRLACCSTSTPTAFSYVSISSSWKSAATTVDWFTLTVIGQTIEFRSAFRRRNWIGSGNRIRVILLASSVLQTKSGWLIHSPDTVETRARSPAHAGRYRRAAGSMASGCRGVSGRRRPQLRRPTSDVRGSPNSRGP